MQVKICEYCEKVFKTHMTLKRFCSDDCRDKGCVNRRRYGGNHFKVLKRDEFKCTECNSKDQLCVHHIDENIRNNKMDNLITLCKGCHAIVHHKGSLNNHYKDVSKEQIIKAIETTDTLEEAAEVLGITRKTLSLKRKEYDLPNLSNGRSGSDNKLYKYLSVNEVLLAFEVTGSWKAAAERLNVSDSFLRKRRQELGIEENKNPRLKEISKEMILDAIERTPTLQEASNLLGITRKTLMKKRKDFGLME